MKKIEIEMLSENFIETIGKEWMLITAGSENNFNTMTANWGNIGYLWNKPVVSVFVRPERYTFEFMERESLFTLSFMGNEHREIYKICGSCSGRDIDKVKEAKLSPCVTERGGIYFREARLVMECKMLYADMLKDSCFFDSSIQERWYGEHGGMHKMYIAEIVNVLIR